MARTDATNVGLIIEVDAAITLTAFIDTANVLVTELCTGANGPTPVYDAARLELIERWLAAHFYAIRDNRVANEKAGSVGQAFQYSVGPYLRTTMYGQQAILLDTNGGLATLNKNSMAGISKNIDLIFVGDHPDDG